MYRENRLKKTLEEGGKALGCWCTFNDSLMSEMLALCGFDFTLFDHEHTPASFENLIAQLHAISATPTTSIVRVPGNDRLYIKRTLDAGAEGIMIPNVDTADDARSIVDACRYPPAGRRGTGINTIRAANFGMAGGYEGYGRTANDELLIICQIESPQGVENAEEIAGVEGVDALFIGPFDMSCVAGPFGDVEAPIMKDLIARFEAACRNAGKPMGTPAYGKHTWKEMFERGYQIVGAGSDVAFLKKSVLPIMNEYRKLYP